MTLGKFEKMVRFGGTISIDENGHKQFVGRPKAWQNLKVSQYNGEPNYAILTGKINNIFVIDLDRTEEEKEVFKTYKESTFNSKQWFEERFGALSDMNTLITTSRRGGLHIYFKYTDKIKGKKIPKVNLDLLSDRSCCYEGAGYAILYDSEIREMSEAEISTIVNARQFPLKERNEDKFETCELWEVLDNLKESRYTEYNEWIEVGFALYKEANGLELFKRFSRKCQEKYDKQEIEEKWETFDGHGTARPKTKASLYDWLKEDNPSVFKRVQEDKKMDEKKRREIMLVREMDNMAEEYSIKHLELIKNTKTKIEAMSIMDRAMEMTHNMLCKDCNKAELYGSCSKDGYQLQCKNCDYKYPDNRISIDKTVCPNIYNSLTVNVYEDINTKDTLQVARRIDEYTSGGLLYTGEWYMYNTENGLYERKKEVEVIRIL